MKTKYKYCVKTRFSSEFYTQPEWVTVSYHATLEGAKRELDWQKKHGGECLQAKISHYEV